MNLAKLFRPKPTLSASEVRRGLRWMTWEGVASAGDIAGRVSHAVSRLVEQTEGLREHGADLARHAIRGAVHGAGETTEDVGTLVKEAAKGILYALGRTSGDSEDVLWGIGYGALQGSIEAGVDPGTAATQAIEGVTDTFTLALDGGQTLAWSSSPLKRNPGQGGAVGLQ